MAASLLNICLRKSSLYSACTVHLCQIQTPVICSSARTLAVAPSGKAAAKFSSSGSKKIEFEVEKDPHRLVEYCCGSNIFKEGEDVKLKAESEYPDWLWTLHTGPAPKLEELDPNSKEYWLYVRREARKNANRIRVMKIKYKKF